MKRLIAGVLALSLAFTGALAQALPKIDAAFDARVTAAHTAIMRDPPGALSAAAALHRDAESLPPAQRPLALGISDWLAGEALLSLNRPQQALGLIERGLRGLQDGSAAPALHGELISARGGAFSMLGRIQQALEDYQRAYRLFGQAGESRGQSIALINIGAIYRDAGDFENALRYNAQAIELYSSDPSLLITAYNNRGNALTELHRYADADREYRRALAVARRLDNSRMTVRILQNIARAEVWANHLDAADVTLSEGFVVSRSEQAKSGRPALYGVAAMVALRRHQLDRAAALIERAFAEGNAVQATMPVKDFHRAAYEIFKARGDRTKALSHLESFKQLDDEARTLAASTNAALIRARFDFANQDLKIAHAQARLRTTVAAGLLTAAAVISTLLAIGFFSIRRSRNQVRAANETLTTTNAELAKALAAKTEFLATTSHEIRTPLNGILGMTQVILSDRSLGGSLRDRIELVHGAGETMRALVDDILDVAKMETGELKIHPAEMDLRRLLDEAAKVWAGQAETKRIGIALDIADAPPAIVADEVRLRQIVFNLMSNAIKFTDRGKVGLRCRVERATGEDERLVIEVQDSGIGIPGDRLNDIFESFRQIDGGTTRRHGGTGLGLAICRNLARAMGGDVTVASQIGAGSTFTVELPLVRVALPAPIPASARAAADSLAAAELLLVEANPLSQGILRALLTPRVQRLQIVTSPDEAIDALAGNVDHILADAGTLTLDLAVAERLARAATQAGARLTILWSQPDAAIFAALEPLQVQLVAKPISPPDLLAALQMGYQPELASRNVAA